MSIKKGRMEDRIHGILSTLLLREISDPRLKNITVTEVTLDPELMFATIYVNALGDESRQDEVIAGLQRASGFLRREVGKRIRLRHIPELHFHWDTTLQSSEHLHRIFDKLEIPPEETDEDDDGDS